LFRLGALVARKVKAQTCINFILFSKLTKLCLVTKLLQALLVKLAKCFIQKKRHLARK